MENITKEELMNTSKAVNDSLMNGKFDINALVSIIETFFPDLNDYEEEIISSINKIREKENEKMKNSNSKVEEKEIDITEYIKKNIKHSYYIGDVDINNAFEDAINTCEKNETYFDDVMNHMAEYIQTLANKRYMYAERFRLHRHKRVPRNIPEKNNVTSIEDLNKLEFDDLKEYYVDQILNMEKALHSFILEVTNYSDDEFAIDYAKNQPEIECINRGISKFVELLNESEKRYHVFNGTGIFDDAYFSKVLSYEFQNLSEMSIKMVNALRKRAR